MTQFHLKTLFLFVTLLCVSLPAGRYFVARSYVDDVGQHWVPGVRSVLPIFEARTYLNDEPGGAFVACDYEFWGHITPYYSAVELGCLPKCEFTELDTATISVRTIFGWSHFDVRRVCNDVTIEQRY